MKKSKLKQNTLSQVKLLKFNSFKDRRGNFNKIFSKELFPFFEKNNDRIKEVNHCYSKKRGTIRGMHFQQKNKQTKIITVLSGKILDVSVNLRKKSKDFGKAFYFNMSEGDQIRDYLHISELVEKIKKLSLNNRNNGIVNLCSGVGISMKDLVNKWIKTNNWNIKVNLGYYEYNKDEPMSFWGNNSKYKKIFKIK